MAKGQQEIANKYGGLLECSLANSAMPKANTRWEPGVDAGIPTLLRFNQLRGPTGLAWRVPLPMAGPTAQALSIPL